MPESLMPESHSTSLNLPSAGWRAADRAVVAPTARIGSGTRIWDDTFIESSAVVGRDCVIGRGVTIGAGVRVGDRCKIQNGALVYEPAVVADGVFIGPAAVLTNDNHPRAITADGRLKTADDWDRSGVVVESGASIGARAVCVAPVTIGRWSLVGAGAVVTNDVPAFALVVGSPARQIGWVGTTGSRLVPGPDGLHTCPDTDDRFRLVGGILEEDFS